MSHATLPSLWLALALVALGSPACGRDTRAPDTSGPEVTPPDTSDTSDTSDAHAPEVTPPETSDTSDTVADLTVPEDVAADLTDLTDLTDLAGDADTPIPDDTADTTDAPAPDDTPETSDTPSPDLTEPSDSADSEPGPRCEAGLPPCTLAEGETCAACMARLGECCYGDLSIQGQASALAAHCERRVECRRCCDECAASSCESLRAHSCPGLALPAP